MWIACSPVLRDVLVQGGVGQNNIRVVRVPGALEIPLAAQQVARSGRYAAIIALGCVIRGRTTHFDNVVRQCSARLMQVSLETCVPITQGVLGVDNAADATARSGDQVNRGREAASTALEMASLMRDL